MAEGRRLSAELRYAEPRDREVIAAWSVSGDSGDRQWREWWCARMEPVQGKVTLALTVRDLVLGFISLERHGDLIHIEGLRVAPVSRHGMRTDDSPRGVGSALVYGALGFARNLGLSGIDLHSTPGAEGFYRRLGMAESAAPDGIRRRFFLSV